MTAYRSAAASIDQVLCDLAVAVGRLPEKTFLDEHQAAHDEPRSPAIDLCAAVLEREWWRRFPEGRDEDD